MFKKVQKTTAILSLLLPLASHAISCKGLSEEDPSFATCSAEFINPPTFGNLCQNTTITGTYTLRNNSPVPLRINYIRIQNFDALPAAASAIVPSLANSCGSILAPGALCSISVQLIPLAAGFFNRVLQVGINSRQVQLNAPPINSIVGSCLIPGPTPPPGFIPTIPGTPLSLFQSSILGASTVTSTSTVTDPTIINGDLDLTPGTSVTGFPPGIIYNGTQNVGPFNIPANFIKTAALNYFNALNALPCSVTYPAGQDISALPQPIDCSPTGTPVMCFTVDALMTGPVTLSGAAGDSCTFKIASTLTVSNNAIMSTSGGIINDNINWAVGSSATLGTDISFYGIIDAFTSITLNARTTLKGRAWALNGAVTLDTNLVNPTAP
ncbi:MAG: DUF3494 domain-containing protein [Tatlockia sp.]|nr:DUF3494 domain-containing protein [Tatlockia sp.]